MYDNNPADIPATLNFQKNLIPLQEEYKMALKTGEHPDKNFDNNFQLNSLYFEHKCQVIYEHKVRDLSWKIIEEHRKSLQSKIDLLNYPRFKDLVWDALYQTRSFLEMH